MALTVTLTDLTNGGSVQASVTGTDGSPGTTIYVAQWNGAPGALTFAALSPVIVGNATQNYALGAQGLWFAYAKNTQNEQYTIPAVTATTNSVFSSNYSSILSAVSAQISALALSGNPTVAIRKIGYDQNLGSGKDVTLPAILVVPQVEAMPFSQGTNGQDDVTYGVWIMPVSADNHDVTSGGLDQRLEWLETIAREFRNQRLIVSGSTLAYKCEVVPASTVIPDAWKGQLFASAQLLKFTCRETRGN